MATKYWDTVVTPSRPGNTAYHIYADGVTLTADSDVTVDIDMLFYGHGINGEFYMVCTRTAGATDVVDVALQGSHDGTTYTDLTNGTVSSVAGGAGNTGVRAMETYRYYRVLCTTVGAGNTLTVALWLYDSH